MAARTTCLSTSAWSPAWKGGGSSWPIMRQTGGGANLLCRTAQGRGVLSDMPTRVKHHHPNEENMTVIGAAKLYKGRAETATREGTKQSPGTELAECASSVDDHTVLQQQFERAERARGFRDEMGRGEEYGLRFTKDPDPDGQYRIEGGGVDASPSSMGYLYSLAEAAARSGQVKIIRDILLIVRNRLISFDDTRYPIWKHIYEAAYEKLDPKSASAIALKEEFGG